MDGHETCAEGEVPLVAAAAAAAAPTNPASATAAAAAAATADADAAIPVSPLPPGFARVLLVEAGWGCDQHGQSSTKAAVRACRNAIEFNSLAIRAIIPGGVPNMRVHVRLGVPHPETVDEAAVRAVFPYGTLTLDIGHGGLEAPSYVALGAMGDVNDLMVIAVAAVTVGHGPAGGAEGGAGAGEGAAEAGVPSHAGYCE
jgi:uncharacterized protein (TIGR02058 family)